MDIDVITTLINSVGFPIVMCLALFWFIKTLLNKALETMVEFKNAINENTNSINILTTKLHGINNNVSNKK